MTVFYKYQYTNKRKNIHPCILTHRSSRKTSPLFLSAIRGGDSPIFVSPECILDGLVTREMRNWRFPTPNCETSRVILSHQSLKRTCNDQVHLCLSLPLGVVNCWRCLFGLVRLLGRYSLVWSLGRCLFDLVRLLGRCWSCLVLLLGRCCCSLV